jgi:hypothetical protein
MTKPCYADYVNQMLRFYARKIHSGEVLRMKMKIMWIRKIGDALLEFWTNCPKEIKML